MAFSSRLTGGVDLVVIPIRAIGPLLFVGAVFALPLPLFGLEGCLVPAARYWQLAAECLELIAAEGAQGMIGVFAGLLLAHALVYTTLLAALVWALARFGLPRLPDLLRDHVFVIALTLLIAVASFGRVYDSRFHHSEAHATLWELYR